MKNEPRTIFEYTNHREYLRDWFQAKKMAEGFSYQDFAEIAEIRNKGFIYNIINGDKVLSVRNLRKISTAMSLGPVETAYFTKLVEFGEADTPKEKRRLWENLQIVKWAQKKTRNFLKLRRDQFDFYQKWYHAAIFPLLRLVKFKDDWNKLARMVYPRITPGQAKKAVGLMHRLGLIKKDKNGYWLPIKPHLQVRPEYISFAIQDFHIECAKLVKNTLENLDVKKSYICGVTLSVSAATYEKICTEIEDFRTKLTHLASEDDKPDCVYHVNFQVLPFSKNIKKAK